MRIPDNRVTGHPGRLLRAEFLVPMGISQAAFARHIDVQSHVVSELCTGKRGVSPEMCFKLGEALGTGPELWANLQVMHDLSSANLRRKSRRRIPRLRSDAPARREQPRSIRAARSSIRAAAKRRPALSPA